MTAEYAMLPRATHTRTSRERAQIGGRTQEIQRLIGRSLRAMLDDFKFGEFTIKVDCDVLQADGGTRTASITGACVAVVDAFDWLVREKKIASSPVKRRVAAVSVGVIDGEARLDLDYPEDVRAEVDMNVVMTSEGKYVEVQGTGEHGTFDRAALDRLLGLADGGITHAAARTGGGAARHDRALSCSRRAASASCTSCARCSRPRGSKSSISMAPESPRAARRGGSRGVRFVRGECAREGEILSCEERARHDRR